MRIELFGRDYKGEYVFLGTFGKEETVLRAIDEYYAMGFRGLKYSQWMVK